MELIVTEPFGDYAKGDRITDAGAITAALASNPHDVVRIASQKPAAAPAPALVPIQP